MTAAAPSEPSPPRLSLLALFARFLRFGCLAFGGPVAQIGMLKHELVERDRWVTPERFRRALAVYQVLPGPEAHELCCWFGYLARGRVGSLLAGLGFMLPGTLLMLALAALYSSHALDGTATRAAFAGMQPAVLAMIARAVPRIGKHALSSRAAWVAAAAGAVVEAAQLPFALSLVFGALLLPLAARAQRTAIVALVAAFAVACWLCWPHAATTAIANAAIANTPHTAPTTLALLGLGLQAGLLTFGGAYTAIPFVRNEAVLARGWLTDAQFLDSLALGGVLPAPLVVFGTFVGYVAGGFAGGLAMTAGIFAPAFGFTLIGHELFERLVARPGLHAALDGVAAAVVGLIAATAVRLCLLGLASPFALIVFVTALALLLRWKSPWCTPTIVGLGALAGLLLRA